MQKQEFCTKPQIEGITDDFLSHPDGQIFDKAVKAGDLRTANYVLQTRLSTDARIPLVKEYISNTELGKGLIQLFEPDSEESAPILQYPVELVLEALSHISYAKKGKLHRDVLGGILYAQLQSKVENTAQYVAEFLSALGQTGFVEYKNGIFRPYKDFVLPGELRWHLEMLISNPPNLIPYEEITLHITEDGDVKFKGGIHPFSKKAVVHKDIALDFLNMTNNCPVQLNQEIYWNFAFKHMDDIEREPGDTDMDMKQKEENNIKKFLQQAVFMEICLRYGISTVYIGKKMDERHRNYSKGWGINIQGTDRDKCFLTFKPVPIEAEDIEEFKVSLAATYAGEYQGFGLDKCPRALAKQWVDTYIVPHILQSKDKFIACVQKYLDEADAPGSMYKHLVNLWEIYRDLLAGVQPKVWCDAPVDASASGYQWLSSTIGGRDIARMCNVLPSFDEEGNVLDVVCNLYRELTADTGLDPNDYPYKVLKQGIWVPKGYLSQSCTREVFGDDQNAIDKVEEVCNKHPVFRYLGKIPGLWNPNNRYYYWDTPDGARVLHGIKETFTVTVDFPLRDKYGEEEVPTALNITYTDWGYKNGSVENGANYAHSCDAYAMKEIARALLFGTKRKQKVKDLIDNRNLHAIKSFKDLKDREIMERILYCAKHTGVYSLRILTELTENNVDMVPEDVLQMLYARLPEKFTDSIFMIHDSFGVYPQFRKEVLRQYQFILHDFWLGRYFESFQEDLMEIRSGTFTRIIDYEAAELSLKAPNPVR